MGKQRRRKRQDKGKSSSPLPAASEEVSVCHAPQNVLLQRIRHSDPRTRHAALAAVSTTLLDTSCIRVHPKITPLLLQAIRERVMDSDLDVSQVAAGCLSNYLIIATSGKNAGKSDIQNMSAGWTVLVLGRLKHCHDSAVNLMLPDMNAKARRELKQWLFLAKQCLHLLCTLIESNAETIARLTSDFDRTTRQNFHQTLLEWLQVGQAWLVEYSSKTKQEEDEECLYLQKIVILAARSLHSAWDDNADLFVPWQQECADAFNQGLDLLRSIAQNQASKVPVMAKLHATGSLVTARAADSVDLMKEIIPVLLPHLQFDWTNAQNLLSKWNTALKAWEQEQADDAMEKDIIRKQKDRKESARSIARRQKEAGKPEPMQEDDGNGVINDQNLTDMDQKDAELETREALEQVRSEWNDYLLPLQLTLELLANLTSRKEDNGMEDDAGDVMMEDWGPEQEAQLLQQHEIELGINAEEKAAQGVIIDSPLPQKLARLFQEVYHFPQIAFPERSWQDLEDLQYKTMACLGNCWGNIRGWPNQLTWNDLQQAVVTATGSGKEGLISTILVALKSLPDMRKQWQPRHLNFWLQQVQDTSKETLTIQRDVIAMLGVLYSQEPHSKEMNQQVCSALLSALAASDSLVVQCEVLNVLMDMYGGDDDDECYHGSVFESQQVLTHFQKCIPNLKKKLQEQGRQRYADSEERMELEQWKEVVLNASRFVQYKKGHLASVH